MRWVRTSYRIFQLAISVRNFSNWTFCPGPDFAAGYDGENDWLFWQLRNFCVEVPSKKPAFQYRLPLIGNVCKSAWVLCAGFPNPKNSRIQRFECSIRRGRTCASFERRGSRQNLFRFTRTNYAKAFLREYILQNSERSPVTTELYVCNLFAQCLHMC